MRRLMVGAYKQTLDRLTPAQFVGRARHDAISVAVGLLFEHVMSTPALTRSFMEMSLARSGGSHSLRRAFEQLAVQRLAALIGAVTKVPDPEAFAYVLYGAAMQCAYGLAVQLVPTAIDRERARAPR